MTQLLNNETAAKKSQEAQVTTPANESGDRETFIHEIREKLTKIQTKMTSMKADGSKLAGDLKKKADENLASLDGKYKEFQMKLEELKKSTQENWNADKEIFQKSFNDFSTNFKGLFS